MSSFRGASAERRLSRQQQLLVQRRVGSEQRASIIIRNVIALLLLKDRGQRGREGRMEPGDITYVLSINSEPTSLLFYFPSGLGDLRTRRIYCVPLTSCMSHVREHNGCRSSPQSGNELRRLDGVVEQSGARRGGQPRFNQGRFAGEWRNKN